MHLTLEQRLECGAAEVKRNKDAAIMKAERAVRHAEEAMNAVREKLAAITDGR